VADLVAEATNGSDPICGRSRAPCTIEDTGFTDAELKRSRRDVADFVAEVT